MKKTFLICERGNNLSNPIVVTRVNGLVKELNLNGETVEVGFFRSGNACNATDTKSGMRLSIGENAMDCYRKLKVAMSNEPLSKFTKRYLLYKKCVVMIEAHKQESEGKVESTRA